MWWMHRALTVLNHIYKEFKKQGSVFYGSPLNPMSLTCGLTAAAAAAQDKEQGKDAVVKSLALSTHH